MGFEHDLFISYAHIDNAPLLEDQDGWIDTLHRTLEIRLAQLLGEKPNIWRDPKLRGNDYLDETIVDELLKAAILVAVLSPRYVKSKWCLKEIEGFIEAAEQDGGARIADKSRIFKVLKTPVPREEHPADVQDLLGYEFFRIDSDTQRPREFDRVFGPDAERRFWAKLNDLAYDIHQLLEIMRDRQAGAEPQPAAPSGATVYLAETSFDLSQERDQIRRELEARGHTVLPDRPLPLRGPELEDLVRENLQRCTLSIHLVGEHYGIVPEEAERSVIELQNVLAVERAQDAGFSRLIWLPIGLAVKDDERQQAFVTALQNDPEVQRGADVLQTTLEDFKTAILDKLTSVEEAPATDPSMNGGPTRIYLMCNRRDLDTVEPLEDYLFEQGFEVIPPLFEGDEADIREYHYDQLRLCDASLIYYGLASEGWVRVKLGDLRKVFGYGRTGPMLAKAVYVAGPENPRKARFRTREVDAVIKRFNGFSPDVLSPFLTKIEQRTTGAGG